MHILDNIQNDFVTEREVLSFIKGCHMYRNLWRPISNKELYGKVVPCLLKLSGERHKIEISEQQMNDQNK